MLTQRKGNAKPQDDAISDALVKSGSNHCATISRVRPSRLRKESSSNVQDLLEDLREG
jgi:hypothetical protein